MKGISILVLFALCVMVSAGHANAVHYGIKLGVNVTDISGYEHNSTGLTGGLFAKCQLGQRIDFQPEVMYARRGAEMDEKVRFDYISTPFLFQYRIPVRHIFLQPSLVFGPTLNFLINADYNGLPITDRCERTTYDITIGLSGDFHPVQEHFIVDLRYSYGIADIFKNENNRHRVITLQFGYIF